MIVIWDNACPKKDTGHSLSDHWICKILFSVSYADLRSMVQTPWRFTGARSLGDFTGRTTNSQPIHTQIAS